MKPASANRMLGLTAYFHGDFVAAQTYGERALDGPRRPSRTRTLGTALVPTALCSPAYLAPTLWALGHIERARANLIKRRDAPRSGDRHLRRWPTRSIGKLIWKSCVTTRWRRLAQPRLWMSPPERTRWHSGLSIAELAGGWARGRINDPTGRRSPGSACFWRALPTWAAGPIWRSMPV